MQRKKYFENSLKKKRNLHFNLNKIKQQNLKYTLSNGYTLASFSGFLHSYLAKWRQFNSGEETMLWHPSTQYNNKKISLGNDNSKFLLDFVNMTVSWL